MKRNLWVIFAFCAVTMLHADEWFRETLYDDWGQTFKVDKILHEEKTSEQHLMIFENDFFGKVMALDGIIQFTEKDEFVYHEMISHVPMQAHGNAKKVLIIGGGDGGVLREVLKHSSLEKATLVEIDPAVMQMSEEYFPEISNGAFHHPKSEIMIQDGALFVKKTEEKYDIVIIDSTDPIGPGEVLFTEEFYRDCHNCLAKGGILVTQNGVPFLQDAELIDSYQFMNRSFQSVDFYLGVIPTYVGGFMTFGWATDCREYKKVPLEVLQERRNKIQGDLKYYSPEVHIASFALPGFIQNQL